ncbi:MAG TPA: DNA polymerase III subunit delta', partial [Sphingobium sp.]|nr:DNA polymerase III subunit delta' [Sphingobium sp.]
MILGHDAQADMLLAAARNGRMHHGWILAGARGIGKASFARALALRLLAEAAGPLPDEGGLTVAADHPIRKLVEADAHPDYAELYCLEKDTGTARN